MHDGNGPATPTADELIARAKALIPVLAERAPRQEQARRILDETITDLRAAGFFRIVQPRRWGGYEMSPSVLADVQMTLAQGDMSVGWVMGIIAVHPFELALFDDRAAQDVWGKDTGVLVGSSYMPTGKATPTEGGFRFSGRWRFSSGSDHCRWLFLGGAVQSGDPSQGLDYRTFLLPVEDCELIDTWQVFGLKGTGSKDVVVRDVFVPAYRTTQAKDILGGSMPGLALNTAPLYRMPYAQVFLRVVSTAALGALQGMLDVFREVGSQRVAVMGNRTAKDPDAQLACAQAMVEIAEMKLVLHHNFAKILALAERNELPSVTDRLLYKYQSAAVPERCAVLASQLFEASGGTGVFETSPLGRFYRDILTARQHAGNQVPAFGRNLGATLLGLDNPDFYF